MTELHSYVLAALLHFAPPTQHDSRPWADPSPEYALARYTAVAGTISELCETKKHPRVCASLMAALAIGESAIARDADEGPLCVQTGGWKGRCDHNTSASVWQVKALGIDADGPITVARLFASRPLAARIAYRAAAGSLQMCRHLADPVDRLSGLSGRCQAGLKSARERYLLWRRVSAWRPEVSK